MSEGARAIDPSYCWVRHVRRTQAGEVGVTVGRGTFTAEAIDGVNGRNGWQGAQITAVLQDDGDLSIRFPNTQGDDGILHRRRFAIRSKEGTPYRPGEEWLELYREPHDVLAVATPYSAELSGGELTLKCWTVATLLNRFRSLDLDVWDGAAPRDVWEHYCGAPVQVLGDDFTGVGALPANTTNANFIGANGKSYRISTGATVSVDAQSAQPVVTGDANGAERYLGVNLPAFTADAWTVEASVRAGKFGTPTGGARPLYKLELWDSTGTVMAIVLVYLDTGQALFAYIRQSGTGQGNSDIRRQGLTVEGFHSIRVSGFYEWLFLSIDGELVGSFRRFPTDRRTPAQARLISSGPLPLTMRGVSYQALTPFALRGADKGELRVPGTPPAGGLRMRTYSAAATYQKTLANSGDTAKDQTRSEVLPYLYGAGEVEPAFDGQVADLNGRAITNGLGANTAAAAVFSGAIYLPGSLGTDLRLRITGGPAGPTALDRARCRIYLAGKLYLDNWLDAAPAAYPLRGARVTSFLGITTGAGRAAGWYPIKIEVRGSNVAGAEAAVKLEWSEDTGFGDGTYVVVTPDRLSPLGTYDGEHRNESHRSIIGELTETFGYQWRVDPRTLESGEFPGQIIPRLRVGRDYAPEIVVADDEATELVSTVDAGDVADRLIGDAAGIADPNGAGQLSAELVDFDNAALQSFLASNSESFSDITVLELLLTRINTVHALHLAPNETVGARPRGQRDLSKPPNPFTLEELAKTRWLPGDGVKLTIDALDVTDRTPRQLTRVTQAVFPDGVTPPQVAFRDRPRDSSTLLRRLLRIVLAPQRNYQGTLTFLPSNGAGIGGAGGTADTYSRAPLPPNVSDVAGAWLVVKFLTQTAAPTIEINGVNTQVPVTGPGWYDVKPFVDRAVAGSPYSYGRLINGTVTQAAYDLLILVKR